MTRFLSAVAVLTVALIAAVVSFGHIEAMALVNGQTVLAARLLPLSVDGAILAASMTLLDYARRGVPAPTLARIMLALSVLATLAANAAFGAAHGPVGILVSAWPAVAFTGSAEVLLAMIRGRSQEAPATEALPGSAPAPEGYPRPLPQPRGGGPGHCLPRDRRGVGYTPHRPTFSAPSWRPGASPASARSSGAAKSARTGPGRARCSSLSTCPSLPSPSAGRAA